MGSETVTQILNLDACSSSQNSDKFVECVFEKDTWVLFQWAGLEIFSVHSRIHGQRQLAICVASLSESIDDLKHN